MSDSKKKLLLIDTFGLVYKLYYTLPGNMRAPDGKVINAAYGFARLMLKIWRDVNPDYLVAAMESKIPTFRHNEYSEYKAHRDKMPDDLREQIPIVEEIIEAMGLAPAQKDGFEADDVIGTLAGRGARDGFEVEVITGDRDLLQLVEQGVTICLSKKGVTDLDAFDREKVKETQGVFPEQIPDKKGLEGDKSDNIPGVPGVGKVTANKLLNEYGTLEKVYESLDLIKSKSLHDKLAQNKELAFLSRRLGMIARDVELDANMEDYRFRKPDVERLAEIFQKYNFKTLIHELGDDIEEKIAESIKPVWEQLGSKYRLVTDETELKDFLDRAKPRGRLCVDLETMGLNPFTDAIVGWALAVEPGDAIYVPVLHDQEKEFTGDMFDDGGGGDGSVVEQISPERALEIIRPYIEDPEIECWGHNLKFDLMMVKHVDGDFANIGCDTFIEAYLADPSSRSYGLKPLASHLLNINMRSYSEVVASVDPEAASKKGGHEITFSKVPVEDAVDYACADVDTVLRIEPKLTAMLEEKNLVEIFKRIEMPLIKVLAQMEYTGIAIDVHALKEFSIKLGERENLIESRIRALAGRAINPKSPKQVAELLFDDLQLPAIQKRSTDVSVLEQLADKHEVVPLIMEHRHLSKLRGTYVDALPEAVNPQTKRIHTSFNQTFTATGRLSSSGPNLQNIPIRTEEGRRVRRAFVPGVEGYVLLAADYSQVEVRILAHMSGDPTLLESFRNKEDIHTRTAAEVFGLDKGEVSSDQRRYAKTINFGILYGKTPFGLAAELGIMRHEAAEFIDRYFERYPKILEFIETTKEESARDGFVKTLFGRRRDIPETQSANANQREGGFRAAVNTRIQGTAADIIKMAMIKVYDMVKSGELDASVLLQVHDELVLETPAANMQHAASQLKQAMETAADDWIKLDVDLVTDVKAGPNWLDMEKVDL